MISQGPYTQQDRGATILFASWRMGPMTLLTAHKILITTAVVFFLFYAAWEARRALAEPSAGAGWWAAASAVVAVALAIYLWKVWRGR